MDVSGGQKILAPGDVGNFLRRVIDHHREVIRGSDILPGQNDIAEKIRSHRDLSKSKVPKGQRTGQLGSLASVKPPRWLTLSKSSGLLSGRELTAGSGVEGTFGALGGAGEFGQFLLDFAAGAEAWVDDAERAEFFQCFPISREAVELVPRGSMPRKTEPAEVAFDVFIMLRPDAGVIDVLEAQEESPVRVLRQFMGHESGMGVPEMEISGGAGRETGRDHGVELKKY